MSNILKYRLGKKSSDTGLYRIVALRDIPSARVTAGQTGGWVASEANLSQVDNAWVYGSAQVYGNARVCGDALVYGEARVYGSAWAYGDALVYGEARVYGSALVCSNAQVYGDARVYGNAQVTVCLQFQQLKHGITITDKYVSIGCENHTHAHWRKQIASIGKKNEYTAAEIRETKQLLEIGIKQVIRLVATQKRNSK